MITDLLEQISAIIGLFPDRSGEIITERTEGVSENIPSGAHLIFPEVKPPGAPDAVIESVIDEILIAESYQGVRRSEVEARRDVDEEVRAREDAVVIREDEVGVRVLAQDDAVEL